MDGPHTSALTERADPGERGRTEERRAAHRDSLVRRQTRNYNFLKKVPETQSGGQKCREHSLPEVAHTEPHRGHKCERRARERLRCKQTKLAAHLECISHQWKMPTSYPNFSSGKTKLVWQCVLFVRKVQVRLRVRFNIIESTESVSG